MAKSLSMLVRVVPTKPVIKIATQKKNIQGKVTEYDYDKLQTGKK